MLPSDRRAGIDAASGPDGTSVWVSSAFEPEIRLIREWAARDLGLGKKVHCAPIGVGLVDASAGAERFLNRRTDLTCAIFIGTAGSLTSKIPIGAVVVASEVGLGSYGQEIPGQKTITCETTPSSAARAHARVVTTLGVTTDEGAAREYARSWDVEHMEAYAFARVCSAHGIPYSIVLGISNRVGPRGREEWRQNHESVSAAACHVAIEMLTADYLRNREG